MKKHWLYIIALTLGLSSCEGNSGSGDGGGGDFPELKKVVEAWRQGGGSATKGGSTSTLILHVTTLADGPQQGTLRYALTVAKPRIVVFDVAGTIYLTSPLEVLSKVTVLGQSAPGQGICVAGYPVKLNGADDVIFRYMRFRLGDLYQEEGEEGDDTFSVNGCRGVMLDHCSFSWSTDEVCSCYGNWDFTMQYCFITEALTKSVHVKGDHGYGGIWGGCNATFHHNLIAHNDSRNPRFDHDYVAPGSRGPVDYVNNVVYNWGKNSTYGGEGVSGARHINMVANYYKPGPWTRVKGSKLTSRLLDPSVTCSNCSSDASKIVPGKFYLTDNYMDGNADVTADNWKGSTVQTEAVKANAMWTENLTQLKNVQTAEDAYNTVLAKAGCSLNRDALDARIVNDVKTGTSSTQGSNGSSNGMIDSQMDATKAIAHDKNGYPVLDDTDSRGVDSDGDGIPDEWERKYGMDPKSARDASARTLVTGYTNLEVYLCDLVKDLY